jgi:PAS domain S-box-containing protein
MEPNELVNLFVQDLTDYAIIILDPHGRVMSWNAGARALLGYAANDMIGRRLSDVYTKADLVTGESSAALKDALAWGKHETTGKLVRRDGATLEAELVFRPLSDPDRNLVGFGVIAQAAAAPAVPVEAAAPQSVAAAAPDGKVNILVVDDDDLVRREAVEQLLSLGYGVLEASNGTDALAVLRGAADIDLLFTDVVMPGGLAGRALADQATQVRPGLRVLFASGYFEGALVGKGDLDPDVQFLVKPYRKRELARKIEEVLRA